MQSEAYYTLFQRIRDHCERNEWFGPDADNPRVHGRYELVYWFDSWDKAPPLDTYGAHVRRMYDPEENANVVVIDRHTDPRRHGFAHPPATEQQLRDTEAALGFPLPPLLRAMYAQLANGGFGPSYGIFGTPCGYSLTDEAGADIVAAYHAKIKGRKVIDLSECEVDLQGDGYLKCPPGTHPARLLRLAYEGCGITYDIHADTSQVFWWLDSNCFELKAASLEDWLDQWLVKAATQSSIESTAAPRDWTLGRVAKLKESSEAHQFDPTLPPNPIAVMGQKLRDIAYGSSPSNSEEEEE
jgi:SMI1/KNR4 family protein SUKH-1